MRIEVKQSANKPTKETIDIPGVTRTKLPYADYLSALEVLETYNGRRYGKLTQFTQMNIMKTPI